MTKQEAWNDVIDKAVAENPEELFEALSVYFKLDAESEKHATVVSILNGLSEDMHNAAFAYYASTK